MSKYKLTNKITNTVMSTGTRESIQMLWNAMSHPENYTMTEYPHKSRSVCNVWCEWDMGFSNITDNESIFASREDAIVALESVSWGSVGYETWEEVVDDGLLSLSIINI